MKIYTSLFLVIIGFNLFSQPVAEFTADKKTGCGEIMIRFDARYSSGYTELLWDFGNGQTNTGELKPLVLYSPGNYKVTLTATDGISSDTRSMDILIYKSPDGNIQFTSKDYGCVNDTINFRANIIEGDAPITKVDWIYGDGLKGSGESSYHSYSFPNPDLGYPLVLELTDTNNCSFKTYRYIRILAKPELTIDATTYNACDTGSIAIHGIVNSISQMKEFTWDFGDGTQSNQLNNVHKYANTGTYNVVFQATDVNGCSNIVDTTVRVFKMKAEILNLNEDTVCLGDTLVFNSGISDASLYKWTFNDTAVFNVENPELIVGNQDSLKVKLQISSDYCESSDSLMIHISTIIADFEMDTSWVCLFPYSVTFSDNTLGNTQSWLWEFGDGSTSNVKNPVHTFNDSSTIKLTATTKFGCVSSNIKHFGLKRPKPIINASVTEGCIPLEAIHFNADSSIPVTQIDSTWWELNNGLSNVLLYGSDVYFDYLSPIIDTVILTIVDNKCGMEKEEIVIKAGRKPLISFNTEDTLCIYNLNFFENTSYPSDSIDYHKWNIDSNFFESKNLTTNYFTDIAYYNPMTSGFEYIKEFAKPGDTSVIELIEGFYGCYDTLSKTLPLQGPVADITEDYISSCENPLEHNFVVDMFEVKKLEYQYTNIKNGSKITDSLVFNDNTTSTEIIKTVLAPGFYHLKISVSDMNGLCDYESDYTFWDCKGTTCNKEKVVIGISDFVSAGFNVEKDKACANEIIKLDYAASDNAYVYEWYKNNGSGEQLINPFYSPMETTREALIAKSDPVLSNLDSTYNFYNTPDCQPFFFPSDVDSSMTNVLFCERGLYDIKLVAIGLNGCSDTLLKENVIKVFKPGANFTAIDPRICYPEQARFILKDAIEDTTLTLLSVFFGNNESEDFQNTSDTIITLYDTTGIYHPVIMMKDTLGCVWEENFKTFSSGLWTDDYIQVSDPEPVIISKNYLCINDEITFTSSSDFSSLIWNFGDGNIITGGQEEISHVYNIADTFDISLIVNDETGCSDTAFKTLVVLEKPVVNISVNATFWDCPVKILEIEDKSGSPFITDRIWKLKNTSLDTLMPEITTPSNIIVMPIIVPGKYNVSLNFTSEYCGTFDVTYISVFELSGPHLKMIPPDHEYCRNHEILFIPDSSSIFNSPILQNWSFINTDSNKIFNSEDWSTTMQFSDPGKYQVRMNYYDSSGCQQYDTNNFLIHQLKAEISGFDPVCDVPAYIELHNLSSGSDSIVWYASDTIYQHETFYDTLYAFGSYPVRLEVFDTNGCIDSKEIQIVANSRPKGIAGIRDTLICLHDSVKFSVFTGLNYTYSWEPATLFSNSQLHDPMASSDVNTTVRVYITDSVTECTKVDSATIRVQDAPVAEYSYNYLPYGFDTVFMNISEIAIPKGDTIRLNAISNQQNIIYTWTGAENSLSCYNCPNPLYPVENDEVVTVQIIDSLNCYTENNIQNFIIKIIDASVEMPTAFSPNGDGANDEIKVNGPGLEKLIYFRIYDNLGNLLFETDDISQTWNGQFNNKTQPVGLYSYHIKVKPFYSEMFIEKTGIIKLIK